MTHLTCRLSAKNRDQLRNAMLGNRVWATFTFLTLQKNNACTTFMPEYAYGTYGSEYMDDFVIFFK